MHLLIAQQSEYLMMYLLVALFVILGSLSVGFPRFRRAELLTEEEKKRQINKLPPRR